MGFCVGIPHMAPKLFLFCFLLLCMFQHKVENTVSLGLLAGREEERLINRKLQQEFSGEFYLPDKDGATEVFEEKQQENYQT